MTTRSSSVAAKPAAQGGNKDDTTDIATSMMNLSLEERDKHTRDEIEESVNAEIRLGELESKLELLKAERDRIRTGKAEGHRGAARRKALFYSGATTKAPGAVATFSKMVG